MTDDYSDKTIPPGGAANAEDMAFDPERTVPGIRIRRSRGELNVGDVVLGRYELLEKLGSGAMGVVFKCRDQVSQAEYALKMVPHELARDAEAMEEVRENFLLVHGLKHPNIASVDFLERDEYGAYFLIMEYVRGENLSQWLKRRWKTARPELEEVAAIIKQIASALDYAHRQGILHRDVKPANVMVDPDGNVKVLDFGLASKVRSSMTAVSVDPLHPGGTPNYLSPEQFKGRAPSPASDQYALGVMTYQMLAGYLPFRSDDPDVLRTIVTTEPPEPVTHLSVAANRCLLKVLNKKPLARFAGCTEFAEALAEGKGIRVSPLMTANSGFVSKEKKKPRHRLWWWSAIIAVVALGIAAVLAYPKVFPDDDATIETSDSASVSETTTEDRVRDPAGETRKVTSENIGDVLIDTLIDNLGAILLGIVGLVVLIIAGQALSAYLTHRVSR